MIKRVYVRKGLNLYLPVLVLLFFSLSCQKDPQELIKEPESSSDNKKTRTVSYYKDKSITLPINITRVASGWNAQNSIIAMLGYGDKIVATTDIIKKSPIFAKFVPSIKDAVVCFIASGELNTEGLLRARPDVAFIPSGSGEQKFEQLQKIGIPVVFLKSNSIKNIIERTVITGRILGDDAHRRAMKYVEYFNHNVKKVNDKVSQIPLERRVRVYHSLGGPLMTSCAPSLVQDWMDLAGVINIAKDWKIASIRRSIKSYGNAHLEQIIAANPDVIVCMNSNDARIIRSDPAWSSINAVKNDKVYVNPKGMFYWCRETSEEALQFLWLAKTVYPELFQDIDMEKETRNFYRTFYGYDLNDEYVQLFLYPELKS